MAEWSEAELEERNRIIRRMMGARTLAEAREAKSAVRAWRAQHPEDDAILSGGEVLSHATDFAELRDAERRALGFRDETGLERERVFVQAERAFTLDEIVHARRELLAWRWKYVCRRSDYKRNAGVSRRKGDARMGSLSGTSAPGNGLNYREQKRRL